MSLFHHTRHFHLFALQNREIDALYIAVALISFATGLISIFVPIYFWQLGIPIWQIIFFYFLQALYYVALTFLLLPIIRRLSDKIMMFLGIPFLVLYYIGLSFVSGAALFFYILPIALALYSLFFNVGYQFDFSVSADDGHIGEEIGLSRAIIGIVKFATPFLGGLLIHFLGFSGIFIIVSGILLLAIVPFFFIKQRKFSPDIRASSIVAAFKDKAFRFFHIATVGYVMDTFGASLVWPLFLFLAVGSIETLGGLISLGLLAGVAATFISGRLADKNKGRAIMSLTTIGEAIVWFVRTIAQRLPLLIGSHIFSYLFRDALLTIWTRTYYTLLRTKEKPGIYVLGQEAYYNVVRVAVFPVLILIAFLLPLSQFFITSFVIAGVASFLYVFSTKQSK